MSFEGPGTILGGLPVWAEIDAGKDADTPNGPGDYWAEVRQIYWRKRNGSKGKPIPQHLFDKAAKYDYKFCDLIEQVQDHWLYYKESNNA